MKQLRLTNTGNIVLRSVLPLTLLVGGLGMAGAVAGATSAPTITTVTPSSLPAGAIAHVVTLTGTGFAAGAKVTSHSGITMSTTTSSSTGLGLSVTVSDTEAPDRAA